MTNNVNSVAYRRNIIQGIKAARHVSSKKMMNISITLRTFNADAYYIVSAMLLIKLTSYTV